MGTFVSVCGRAPCVHACLNCVCVCALPRAKESKHYNSVSCIGPIIRSQCICNHIITVSLVSGEGCSLVLKPARVVVKFGEPVSVTCEAARPVRVLGWESTVGAAHTQQDLSVQWKADSLIDWIEEPICYGVFFTAPRQCEEKLNLVLYSESTTSFIPSSHIG